MNLGEKKGHKSKRMTTTRSRAPQSNRGVCYTQIFLVILVRHLHDCVAGLLGRGAQHLLFFSPSLVMPSSFLSSFIFIYAFFSFFCLIFFFSLFLCYKKLQETMKIKAKKRA